MEKKFMSKKGFIGDTPYETRVFVEVDQVGTKEKPRAYITPVAELILYGDRGAVVLSFDNWKNDGKRFQEKEASKLLDLVDDFYEAVRKAAVYLDEVKDS